MSEKKADAVEGIPAALNARSVAGEGHTGTVGDVPTVLEGLWDAAEGQADNVGAVQKIPPDRQGTVQRILDVNLNRLVEALRVVEDAERFSGSPAVDFMRVKAMRHRVGRMRERVRGAVWARDPWGDSGLTPDAVLPDELSRTTIRDVVLANLSRAKESLRSVEEYAKVPRDGTEGWLVAEARECRRAIYDIEREIILRDERAWLFGFSLYVLTDQSTGHDLYEKVARVIAGGADVIQFRRKGGCDKDLIEDARELRRITREAGIPLIINDRTDIALMVGADGVHLGQEDIPLPLARSLVGDSMLIGVSTHTPDQARTARAQGADYVGAGPVFSAESKEVEMDPIGIRGALGILRAVDIPGVAIGGIREENLDDLVRGGITRVGIMSGIMGSPDPEEATRVLKRTLKRKQTRGLEQGTRQKPQRKVQGELQEETQRKPQEETQRKPQRGAQWGVQR